MNFIFYVYSIVVQKFVSFILFHILNTYAADSVIACFVALFTSILN